MMTRKTTWTLLLLATAITGFIWQSVRLERTQRAYRVAQAQHRELLDRHEEMEHRRNLDAEPAELAELRHANEAMRRDVARLRGQIGGMLRAQSNAIAATAVQPGLPGLEGFSPDALSLEGRPGTSVGAGGNASPPSAAGIATNLYLEAQLARARERLQLNPQQEQAIREAVANSLVEGSEHLRKVLNGEAGPNEVPTQQEWALALEKRILAELAPEQQAAYQKHKQEDISANARLLANGELLAVQNALGLSQDQQDQVFAVFYEHAANELGATSTAVSTRPREPLAALEWQAELKRKALEAVLSPVQLDSYSRLQHAHIQYVKGLFTAAGGQPKP